MIKIHIEVEASELQTDYTLILGVQYLSWHVQAQQSIKARLEIGSLSSQLRNLVKGLSSLPITKNLTNRDAFLDKTFLLSMEKVYRDRANNYIPETL